MKVWGVVATVGREMRVVRVAARACAESRQRRVPHVNANASDAGAPAEVIAAGRLPALSAAAYKRRERCFSESAAQTPAGGATGIYNIATPAAPLGGEKGFTVDYHMRQPLSDRARGCTESPRLRPFARGCLPPSTACRTP